MYGLTLHFFRRRYTPWQNGEWEVSFAVFPQSENFSSVSRMAKKKRSPRRTIAEQLDSPIPEKHLYSRRKRSERRKGFNKGYDSRRGVGKKGRSGRTPEAWRELCRELVSRKATIKAAKTILENEDHPAWTGAFKFMAEQGYGRAKESLELKGTLTLEDLVAGSRDMENADDPESIDENDD